VCKDLAKTHGVCVDITKLFDVAVESFAGDLRWIAGFLKIVLATAPAEHCER